MKKLTEPMVRKMLAEYFNSRCAEKRDAEGNPVLSKNGEVLTEWKPCTVTGIALALGMTSREELSAVTEPKIKALIDRALLRVEESAEEKLFYKDTAGGAKLFLSVNFKRYAENGSDDGAPANLGVCSVWAE